MKETLISFDTAVLAKEKGFDGSCNYCYDSEGDKEAAIDYFGDLFFTREHIDNADENGYEMTYVAPTQSLLQKWLREDKYVQVWVEPMFFDRWDYVCYVNLMIPNNDLSDIFYSESTYEQALEKGLQEALKLI